MNKILLIHRHEQDWLYDGGVGLLPFGDLSVTLLTHHQAPYDRIQLADFVDVFVCNLEEDDEWERVADWILRCDDYDHIVAPNERFLLLAAAMRSRFNIPGLKITQALEFRDKVLMKLAVSAVGVRVPAFRLLSCRQDIIDFAPPRWPAILKRTNYTGGMDVHIVSRGQALDIWQARADGVTYQIEEFIQGVMFHCDSVVNNGVVTLASVSRYLSKPGDYRQGGVGGSVVLQPSPLYDRLVAFNSRVLHALPLTNGVTHLEVFLSDQDEIVFCEIAARPGGGGISEIVLLSHGVNLVQCSLWLEAGLGLPPSGQGSSSVWGCIGLYPGATEVSRADLSAELLTHVYDWKVQSPQGETAPEHCTDYEALIVLTAETSESFDDVAARFLVEIGRNQILSRSRLQQVKTGDLTS